MRETSLITKFNQKDQGALKEIYKRYHKLLFFYIIKFIDNGAQAEEIAQDCFLKIFQLDKEFNTLKDLENFLFVISRNAALNFLKKSNTEKKYLNQYSLLQESNADIESITTKEYDLASLLTKIVLSIQKLPRQQREVIELLFFDGKNYKEVAQIKGIHLSRVYAYREYAIKAIRRMIGQDVDKLFPFLFIISGLLEFFFS